MDDQQTPSTPPADSTVRRNFIFPWHYGATWWIGSASLAALGVLIVHWLNSPKEPPARAGDTSENIGRLLGRFLGFWIVTGFICYPLCYVSFARVRIRVTAFLDILLGKDTHRGDRQ